MILLNALKQEGVESIPVKHPCDEVGELLRIELGPSHDSTVRITAGKATYESRRDDVHRRYDEAAYEDLPDASHYMRALVAGGLVDVRNRAEIEEFLSRHAFPDLQAGHEPVFAGIDANLFPWRIPHALDIDPELPQYETERPPINGYALASGVKEELDWYYKQQHTRQVTDAFGPEFERLSEQPAGGNRAGYLGLYEYRRLRATRRTRIVETGTGDEAIIEGYKHWEADDSNRRVVLFSNDYGFVDQATEKGVRATHVEFPLDTPRTVSVPWEVIRDTLYVLTIAFGVLVLPKVTLYGTWNGKDGRHWKNEEIDVECRSPRIEPALQRGRSLVTSYEQLY